MAQQPSREFASTDPPTRAQDARLQERRVSAKISLSACSRSQHLQRRTPSHFSKNAPSLQSIGDGDMARGSRGRLKICEMRVSRVFFRQRDSADEGLQGSSRPGRSRCDRRLSGRAQRRQIGAIVRVQGGQSGERKPRRAGRQTQSGIVLLSGCGVSLRNHTARNI
jgi:hypothetical protein